MKAVSRALYPLGWEEMNGMERDYCLLLKADIGIRRWVWQGIRLRLAKGTYYTPDFLVFRDDGTIEIHETKGFMREAARVRINTVAELYPELLLKLITKKKGRWIVEDQN